MTALDPNPVPPIGANGMTVLERRYLARDEQGNVIESPADLFRRVAHHVAQAELEYGASLETTAQWAEKFYGLMAQLAFLPNSPTLMNAGRPLGQLSACFVLPIEDSLDSIFETLKHAALIHQSGGGTGFCFSRLRPEGDTVRETQEVAAGPIAFMEVYNAAVDSIKQGGTRKGANMGLLRVDHPDVERFISAKDDLRRITNFNISIGVTDAFMEALQRDADFILRHPNTGDIAKTVRASALMDQIVDCAWRTGEPGLIFLDRVNRDNPTPHLGDLSATNPCGEVPLLPYEACNLGSINLMAMLDAENRLDWNRLAETVKLAVRFLDNVVTCSRFPVEATRQMVQANRKIGLGLMGWADCLIAQGIPYDADEAIALARDVAAFIDYHSKQASLQLARERGAFANFSQSVYTRPDWLLARSQHDPTRQVSQTEWRTLASAIARDGLRNATTTCIAPTGTISIIAGVSGGIEPVFAWAFTRTVLNNTQMREVHPQLARALEHSALDAEEVLALIAGETSLQRLEILPAAMRRAYVNSFDIAPEWHVRMQAAFQAFTDNGVSKTINFPQSASREAVAQAFQLAYASGIKGLTVYRDQSRSDQPLSLVANPENALPDSPQCIECD